MYSLTGLVWLNLVTDLPTPDFTFTYLPTPTTLFRFSALTFNGHYIHLDKEYAQKFEGYPGKSASSFVYETSYFFFEEPELCWNTGSLNAKFPSILSSRAVSSWTFDSTHATGSREDASTGFRF